MFAIYPKLVRGSGPFIILFGCLTAISVAFILHKSQGQSAHLALHLLSIVQIYPSMVILNFLLVIAIYILPNTISLFLRKKSYVLFISGTVYRNTRNSGW